MPYLSIKLTVFELAMTMPPSTNYVRLLLNIIRRKLSSDP